MTPLIAPTYMTPGIPRFKLPDFSVRISPVLPNRSGIPCTTALGINAARLIIDFHAPLRFFPEVDLIRNEELTSDNEKQDNSGQDIRK